MTVGQHYLIVGEFDPDDDTDRFDIEHPADCMVYGIRLQGETEWTITSYGCHVGCHVEDAGLDQFFIHADDPDQPGSYQERVSEGRHRIEAWSETHRGWEFVEYSGGLRLAGEAA